MKTLKYIFSTLLIIALVWSCEEDGFGDTNFVESITAPTNISAAVSVTQDNTGLVTITPLGEGVATYTITPGDGSAYTEDIKPGSALEHVYEEGVYDATITAVGISGLTTSITQNIIVSFKAPENLVVTIQNDEAISKQVNVTASADYATSYEVYFGEPGNDNPIVFNNEETISYQYAEAGIYTIKVVAMSAAIETTEYTEEFEVTAILQPLEAAPAAPARAEADVISLFSSAYTNITDTNFFPDWGQAGQGSGWATFDFNGDEMLQYINLSYQGIALADGTTIDVSAMEYLHLDVWTADAVTDIETSLINNASGAVTEAAVVSSLNANGWTSIEIPISAYTDQGLTVSEIFQLKFVGTPWAAGTVFIDNLYFYKTASTPTSIAGEWKIAPEAGSLAVGPSAGSSEWWAIDEAGVTQRACYYNDTFVFGSDGSFSNVLGADTWVEAWQGSADACNTPVAPHNGSNTATYIHDEIAGTITLNGVGSYLGIPKAHNTGELSTPADAPASITYNVTLVDINTMEVGIEAGSGTFWSYKLIRTGAVTSPMAGTWKVASEAGSLGVGPTEGSTEWWAIDAAGVTQRACFYDDTYVFGNDGSFSNILGADTWVEAWQGVADSCSAPIAPHDASNSATYTYDASAGTVTLNGKGSYLGIPKAHNTGELTNPVDAPDSITYKVTFVDSNNITVSIEAGSGTFWQYKLVKI